MIPDWSKKAGAGPLPPHPARAAAGRRSGAAGGTLHRFVLKRAKADRLVARSAKALRQTASTICFGPQLILGELHVGIGMVLPLVSRQRPRAGLPEGEHALGVRLAVDELNREGGILGRPVEIAESDPAGDPNAFRQHAERMMTAEGISVIFGCHTSDTRPWLPSP
ncbi:hypothetical protein DPM13_00545 [Paracoccus mutanolyticus]|uniref:Leucine-binding protein domain-containing protein n=1 Tax=Paracoccus mutanolyticus TaxID=1499308 RepID=A0ABN5M6I6_9RHOB|nr:transporter substrate-binding protein [Paracoccus mutanolyticus]AWX92290.1 hypothetical protein DPM13_00545 [Paracoccus mutanolyticus]